MTKDEAQAQVAKLVEHWRSLSPSQIQVTYQEANTRKDFILPLFQALGWNTADSNEVFEERRAGAGAVELVQRVGKLPGDTRLAPSMSQ